MSISSAAGLLALLHEDDPALLSYALSSLLSPSVVNVFWPEISERITGIEEIYENAALESGVRDKAALLASKVYYHLGSTEDALQFALSAGELFTVDRDEVDEQDREYTETVTAACIDAYIRERAALAGDGEAGAALAATGSGATASAGKATASSSTSQAHKMQKIVEQMINKCIRDGEYRQAMGVALDARRWDIIERVFNEAGERGMASAGPSAGKGSSKADTDGRSALLGYVLEASLLVAMKRDDKEKVLRLLVQLFSSLPTPDHFSMVQCFVHLNDPLMAVELLSSLVSPASLSSNPDNLLTAYQIAFDLAESASQEFLGIVSSGLEAGGQSSSLLSATGGGMETDGSAATAAAATEDGPAAEISERLQSILSGRETISLQLEFMYSHSRTDLQILTKTKETLEARNSIFHSAVTFNNAFMNAGTCSDKFLRDNLDWLARASNWSKFSATAALGVIHRGNLDYGMQILQPYLPGGDSGPGASVYSEGGALYALGLVHANNGAAGGKAKEALDVIRTALKAEGGEVVQHGAALGVGVAAMATGNEEIYDDLKDILFQDSAVAGEAVGYAMGLVMLGTASAKALDEMLQYAHETQHEKIIRGLAVGISLLMYGKQEEADGLIDTLMSDKDPILRYGGVHTIAMAYAGTGANSAIRRLLHVAVSDVNDDVRRGAVTALGFILFRSPAQVPRVVQLLSESYNPHVRYGSTIALGVACAGTGLPEAIEILEPLTKDTVDFVRQGACVALAMILIQQNETLNPKSEEARKLFAKIIADKHEDPMAKFGASLSQGLIDAGGRNVTISLMNRNGNASMPAIVGLALFTQFWYWFPMAHAAVLAFTPTAVIGVNAELKMPKFEFTSNARPSIFAYVPEIKAPEKDKPELVKTAVLSTTAKASARQREKEKEKAAADGSGDTAMATDETQPAVKEGEDAEMKVDGEAAAEESAAATSASSSAEKKKKGKDAASGSAQEAQFENLPNLSRVVPAQMSFISFPSSSRYLPVRPLSSSSSSSQRSGKSASAAQILESIVDSAGAAGAGGGILVLKDTKPDEPVELVEEKARRELRIAATGADEMSAEGGNALVAAAAAGGTAQTAGVDLSAPIAPMPEAFEYDGFED